jgi:thioredoxin-like negative regulator of GroEL
MSTTIQDRNPRVGARPEAKPMLVFVHSELSGRCRRAEGYLAQVLQRRRNHETFRLHRLDATARPDLAERFRITTLPTLLIVEEKVVRGRLEDPRGCRDIAAFLEPWLN